MELKAEAGWRSLPASRLGDEVVTSAQFLIDSEASLAGSIQRLDARSYDGRHGRTAEGLWQWHCRSGGLQSPRIRVSHGPIEALGWGP